MLLCAMGVVDKCIDLVSKDSKSLLITQTRCSILSDGLPFLMQWLAFELDIHEFFDQFG